MVEVMDPSLPADNVAGLLSWPQLIVIVGVKILSMTCKQSALLTPSVAALDRHSRGAQAFPPSVA